MKFINKLQEIAKINAELSEEITSELSRFATYLCGPKFQGECENYVSTWEVLDLIQRIKDMQINAEDRVRNLEE